MRCTPREREIQRLRRHARWLLRRELVARQGWPRTLVQTAAWPAMVTLKTLLHLRGRFRSLGPSAGLAAFARIWWLQICHNIRISDQIEFRLDSTARLTLTRSFLSCREQQILLARAGHRKHGYPALDEKRSFARFCEEYGLPHPHSLMQGEGTFASATPDWPETDLLLKPSNLCQGQGVEILVFDPARHLWLAPGGTLLTADNIPAYARNRLNDGPWVIQARLVNPPAWRHLTPGPLSTLRVVTGRVTPDGKPVIIGVQARFAIHSPFVDNVSAGGMSSFVDSDSGRMHIGLAWNGEPSEHPTHPITGGQIEGEIVPDWPALRELALRAHGAAGDWSSIGWDIASTTLGPMLIEANLLWGAISYVPQGHLPFIEIMHTAFGSDYRGIRDQPAPPRHA